MHSLIVALVAYLIGSLPTAYIVAKLFFKKDIRAEGTGNVGARNVYDVTGSKSAGISVTLIDIAKGAVAAWIGVSFDERIVAATLVVAGHIFPVWLGFRGGRGLATSAGVSLVLSPIVVPLWAVTWMVATLIRVPMHLANIIATLALFCVWLLPFVSETDRILFSIIAVLILIAHRKEDLRSTVQLSAK